MKMNIYTLHLQAEEELKKAHADMERKERKFTKEVEEWEKKASELEMDLQVSRRVLSTQQKIDKKVIVGIHRSRRYSIIFFSAIRSKWKK